MGQKQQLDGIDLGSLKVLVLVSDLGSFSAAANRLDVNQSTVSYTVERLRAVFRDPLFLRQGNRMLPTEKCSELTETARRMLDQLAAFTAEQAFDPVSATGSVTVSCNFHERQIVVPEFCARLRRAAPNVRLVVLESAVHGKRQLKRNECDIVLGPIEIFGEAYFRTHLFTDRYVCVMDPENPLTRAPLDLGAYRSARHIQVNHNGEWQGLYIAALEAKGVPFEPSVVLPSHDNLERIIAGSDLIATIPARLAQGLGDRLSVAEFPLEVPIHIDMYWTARTAQSGLHRWARQLLAEVARSRPDGAGSAAASQ
ncbi:HTH-type transcriptional activator NahR (plasmid) [Sinorhizobium americanum CCGM7]|uniref:LysR family transcriptional regulator n=1 Tax=Sinorhizobium americanum TaxID=194963 RepID=UPI0004DA4EEF|nr:LysR family transcriptional regulator [Sinorhizobium americanum]APG87666.1 HTH-type transcriptional activator NahR [Sinorhizobium americanum CCGM7]